MRTFLVILFSAAALAQTPANCIHATAQAESIVANVLGITALNTVDVGVTNYCPNPAPVTEAMIREWFPTLSIENQGRALAVADKAFNSSKRSRIISAINLLSPVAVALIGGPGAFFQFGNINTALKAVKIASLGNSAAQAYKDYLVSQQPNKSVFLPDLPPSFVLAPFGSPGFSVEYTVLGSITFTSGNVVMLRKVGKGSVGKGPKLLWEGNLPAAPAIHGALLGAMEASSSPAACHLVVQQPKCDGADVRVCAAVMRKFREMFVELCDLASIEAPIVARRSPSPIPWISMQELAGM